MPMTPTDWLAPAWPAPATVCAVSTTRHGGVSRGAWTALNLADHVGDAVAAVTENRRRLVAELALPSEPRWMRQVHGSAIARADIRGDCADACVAVKPGDVCVVMTADCLPVLFCNCSGTRVAAAHAGWRGLLTGVLEATLARFDDPPGDVIAWLGPAIGPEVFEVGDEVRAAFAAATPGAESQFRAGRAGHWWADINGLARQRLALAGVRAVSGGDWCTFSDPARFFSYRRDGVTGRMASLIWLQAS